MDISRYIKYFNYGYFLSKYEPKILKELLSATDKVTEINEPLQAGKAQFKKEKTYDKIKRSSNDIVIKKEKGRNISKGK